MRFKVFTQLHRSMIGQMLILWMIFIAATVYYLTIVPLQSIDLRPPDPTYYTVEKVRRELRDFMDAKFAGKTDAKEFHFSDDLKDLLKHNPDFRYYMIIGDEELGSGKPPIYYDKLHLDKLDAANKEFGNSVLCSYYMKAMDQPGNHGYVQYNFCNKQRYYLEFSGINKVEVPIPDNLWNFYKRMVLGASMNLLISAAGVIIITAIILLFNWRLMNKLAQVAYSFDPKNLNRKLPEKGLPHEVLPLVQAVNEMISQIDETQKQHNFFLSTAAHEMRTPLTVLRTRLEMLDDGPLKDKLINDLRRLIHLVNQLLRLMRIGGAKSLDKEIDLVQCCQRVVRERSMLAENAQVTLQFQPEVESYVIPGDEGLLEVAIANLVDNAVSFSEPHSCVDILLHRDGVLSVRDYGPGIPSDKVQSLFEPFAKFPPNRNGHGLGLAIVKAIASLHSAQVDAENMEKGGAQFKIRFHSQFKQNPSQ
ncbi:MAG: hypothetical protein PWP74_2052 [Shewanella sp.]|nr:hypothetical protein [Shewanella sp.]